MGSGLWVNPELTGLDCPAMFMESNVEEHLAAGPGCCCMS